MTRCGCQKTCDGNQLQTSAARALSVDPIAGGGLIEAQQLSGLTDEVDLTRCCISMLRSVRRSKNPLLVCADRCHTL